MQMEEVTSSLKRQEARFKKLVLLDPIHLLWLVQRTHWARHCQLRLSWTKWVAPSPPSFFFSSLFPHFFSSFPLCLFGNLVSLFSIDLKTSDGGPWVLTSVTHVYYPKRSTLLTHVRWSWPRKLPLEMTHLNISYCFFVVTFFMMLMLQLFSLWPLLLTGRRFLYCLAWFSCYQKLKNMADQKDQVVKKQDTE